MTKEQQKKEREELESLTGLYLDFFPQEVIQTALYEIKDKKDRNDYLDAIYTDFKNSIKKHSEYYISIAKARHKPNTNFEEMCDAR